MKVDKDRAAELFAKTEQDYKDRYAFLQKLVALYKGN